VRSGYVVTPRSPASGLGDLWHRRGLLVGLTAREIQVRYRQAALGVAWAVLQPLALMVVTTFVFGRVLGVTGEGAPYALFVLVGLVPWTFFHGAVTAAVPSLVTNADLVRKIHFPRATLPLAAVNAVVLDLLAASAVLLGALMLASRPPGPEALLAIPLLLVAWVAAAAVALLGSAVNVYFRDVKHALPLLLQVLFFATPVVYALGQVPAPWRTVLGLNPLTGVVEGLRAVLLHGRPPDLSTVGVGVAAATALLVAAWHVFRAAERRFADAV
jgi:lipopolysaccharide transport system permease protein